MSFGDWIKDFLGVNAPANQPAAQPQTAAPAQAGRGRRRYQQRPQRPVNVHAFDDLIVRTGGASEQDFRLAILNALLRTPHRQLAPFVPLFMYVHEKDPLFFGRLACWYYDNGSVNDLKQLFIAFMSTSKFSDEYRNAGLALLQKLPPFQVERVLGIVKGHTEGETFIPGIAGSVPRSMRSAIEQYLRERESNPGAFDNVVLHARKPLKTLYASLRIKPGDYAQKVLFDNDPPESSRLYVLKQIAKSEDPGEQARLIVENKIPYRVAISGLRHMTPSVLTALVDAMTPQEIINNLSSLKKRGAMDNDDLRKLIEDKLQKAQTDKRVSALKTREAIKSAGLDEEMAEKVAAVGDKQVKSMAKITRPTALHVDKSGSMEMAIEVGKQIAAIIAPVCEAGLYVYAFDSIAYPINAKGTELSHWEAAFKGINAGGNTSCGAALHMMRKRNERIEQIIMVTDQGENSAPYLVAELQEYAKDLGVTPDVVFVNVGSHSNGLEMALGAAHMMCDTYTFSGDYYSLPSLLPMITSSRLDLLMKIMSYPLPEREVQELAIF